jgi:exodeoxyribonuclease VII large subunit
MTDLANTPEYTVSDLARALKRTVETEYGHVRVRGELGRVTIPKSGHMYLDLKDAEAVIDGVMWKGVVAGLNFRPEEGLEVIAEGRLSTFPGRSKYQIIIERMEPAGAGALMALLEERKRKLAGEGLFAPERKRAIPYLPRVVGVVTSPTGAVIRDILHRLDDRFPVHVLIWPVLVQGEGAAAQIAAGIEGFNALQPGGPVPRPDVIIVARGGGSVEDLWAFNEEIVVRAAAGSEIPLISAVGHETDTTLIDFASDRRAPTPTGAAEIAVPVRRELLERIEGARGRLSGALLRMVQRKESDLRSASRGLPRPESLLGNAQQRLDYAHDALVRGLTLGIERRRGTLERLSVQLRPRTLEREISERRQRLGQAGERMRAAKLRRLADDRRRLAALTSTLEALSYHNVLKRGYAIIEDAKGKLVRSADSLAPGDAVTLRLHDGERAAAIAGGAAAPPQKEKPPARPKPAKPGPSRQGSLF